MTSATIEFIIKKIEANPDFTKFLSNEEIKAVEKYKVEELEQSRRRAKYETQSARINKYHYHSRDWNHNVMYWTKRENKYCISRPYITTGCYSKFKILDISKAEFTAKIKAWAEDLDAKDPFDENVDGVKWMTEQEYFYTTTKEVVGDLIDTVIPFNRFFICYHEPYTVKGPCGNETYGPHISAVDMLRGTGVYAIMSYDHGNTLKYFNEHYFLSMSILTDNDAIFTRLKSEYNFFTKDKNEKFRLCELEFTDDSPKIFNMSEPMTYEEHFKRLYGFLPTRSFPST